MRSKVIQYPDFATHIIYQLPMICMGMPNCLATFGRSRKCQISQKWISYESCYPAEDLATHSLSATYDLHGAA